jgi:hypothetical protein
MGNSCSVNANPSGDDNIGSAQESKSNSASSILSTLTPVAIFAFVWLLVFLVLRKRFPRYYRPRTFVSSLQEHERTPRLKEGLVVSISHLLVPPTSCINFR